MVKFSIAILLVIVLLTANLLAGCAVQAPTPLIKPTGEPVQMAIATPTLTFMPTLTPALTQIPTPTTTLIPSPIHKIPIWNLLDNGTTEDLSDFWGSTASEALAFGGGVIQRYDGSTLANTTG